MRTIDKRPAPLELVQWRQQRVAAHDADGMAHKYEELRRNQEAIAAVEAGLLAEQGGLCAYTGRRIAMKSDGRAGFHVEHLKPQKHCGSGEDTDYRNMVACWPEPNRRTGTPYGAVKKDQWPGPGEETDFVSPLRHDCTVRFTFSHKGKIRPANDGDRAAKRTMEKLRLDHAELDDLRREAITGALAPGGKYLGVEKLRRLRQSMMRAEERLRDGDSVTLHAFCFAILPAIDWKMRKLGGG